MKTSFCKTSILILLLVTLFTSCQKAQDKEPVVTERTLEIKATRVTFEWTVDYSGKFCSLVEISRNEDMSDASIYGSEVETGEKDFSVVVTGLDEAVQYYYRYLIRNSSVNYQMEIRQFTTATITKPTVTTSLVSDVTYSSAVCGGEVTDDGNNAIIEQGVCWSTNHNPETTDNQIVASLGEGSFKVSITGLNSGTVYYVRAYAANSKGVGYGEEVSFMTPFTGAINGCFSVSPSEKVCFSKGNLQYQASSNTWRFAENQYVCVGDDNNNISETYAGWIDLFAFGSSGWNSGAACYQPWSLCSMCDYWPGGSPSNDLTGDYANADWGVYNAISNGGNQAGLWRTPTKDEWNYLFEGRDTPSGIRYAKARVNNVNGVLLLPDDWDAGYYELNNINTREADPSVNIINIRQWNTLEQHGVVFLPSAGHQTSDDGYYWSSTSCDDFYSYCLTVWKNKLDPVDSIFRDWRLSVRLVHPLQ